MLYKVDLDVDMASARDAAVDAFILFYVDGARCARGAGSLQLQACLAARRLRRMLMPKYAVRGIGRDC